MKNGFDMILLNKYFMYNFSCWVCEKNTWNCFHHILGRSSNSILNAAPLCNDSCHINIHGILKKRENVVVLLGKTIKYLLENGYELNENDKVFIEKNKDYYIEILKNV